MKLTALERRALAVGPFIGPRPGSNLWPVVELDGIDGEVLDGLIRCGLLGGTPRADPITLVARDDDLAGCDVDCTHDYSLTPAGRARSKGGTDDHLAAN